MEALAGKGLIRQQGGGRGEGSHEQIKGVGLPFWGHNLPRPSGHLPCPEEELPPAGTDSVVPGAFEK